jgi:hypothetical protein
LITKAVIPPAGVIKKRGRRRAREAPKISSTHVRPLYSLHSRPLVQAKVKGDKRERFRGSAA